VITREAGFGVTTRFTQPRIFMVLGALSAALSVALSAAAAHVPALQQGGAAWASALDQQQLHSLGLIVVGCLLERRLNGWLVASGWLMVAGLLLFCLNIDLRILWGWEGARALVPVGGSAFIASWLAVAVGALKLQR
jgi:uncharacterized membrane protein YgdD (TMEM256/DUF423 family)